MISVTSEDFGKDFADGIYQFQTQAIADNVRRYLKPIFHTALSKDSYVRYWPLADESTGERLKVICYSDGGLRRHSN